MSKKIFMSISNKIFIFLLTAAFFLINSQILKASDDKDLILIIDTSLSMAGYGEGGKNILPEVKKSLPQFIEQLDKNDSITLITFDTEVKLYPTIYISNKKNKESLIDYIKNIKAAGPWTYTSQMMKVAFKKSQELEEKDKDRQRVLVIMTDTIDDPPPDKRGDRLNIKDIAKNYKDKDWFIFYVNFGEALKTNPKLAKMQKELKADISRYTGIIEPGTSTAKNAGKNIGKDAKKILEKDLSENIKKMTEIRIEKERSFPYKALIVALAVIAIVLAGLYYFKRYSGLKVTGRLEYWDHTLLNPYFENYDLTKQNAREVLIGTKNSFNLTIRDIEISDPFKIIAIRASGEIKSTLQAGKGHVIDYINRDSAGFLKNGDMFKVANYTFKYTSA